MLRAFRVSQNGPNRFSEARGDALEGGEAEVSPTLLDEPILSSVHLDVVGKGFLAPVLRFPMTANNGANALLQGRTGALHIATLR